MQRSVENRRGKVSAPLGRVERSGSGNICTSTFLLDASKGGGTLENSLANIQRYRLYTRRASAPLSLSLSPNPMWADVSMKLYPPPDKEDFHFLCVRNANHAHARHGHVERGTIDDHHGSQPRAVFARANCRSGGGIIDPPPSRGFSFVSPGIGYGDRPPVKFQVSSNEITTRLRRN